MDYLRYKNNKIPIPTIAEMSLLIAIIYLLIILGYCLYNSHVNYDLKSKTKISNIKIEVSEGIQYYYVYTKDNRYYIRCENTYVTEGSSYIVVEKYRNKIPRLPFARGLIRIETEKTRLYLGKDYK